MLRPRLMFTSSPCTAVLVSLSYIALQLWHFSDQLISYTQYHLPRTAEVFHEVVEESLPRPSTKLSFSRVSFGLSRTMTPRTTNLLCVFTSQTRRYSVILGPLWPRTPTKSRNGCTNWRIFTPRLSLDMIASPHPRSILPASPVPPWACISPRSTRSLASLLPSVNATTVPSHSEASLTSLLHILFRTVSLLDFSETHGLGEITSRVPFA